MKIIICGSLTAAKEILKVKRKLEEQGYQVEIPHGVKNLEVRKRIKNRKTIIDSEEAEEKLKYGVIKKYYKLIKKSEAVLVVNPTKKGIKNYIGGNTFLEMGFAYVLEKKLYCLYSLPKMPYLAEMTAMKPIILNGDLSRINKNKATK
jgi:nucleoside 2-deoxyribosyltransferase